MSVRSVSEPITRKDLASLQTWVRLSLSEIRASYGVNRMVAQFLDSNFDADFKFHAELTKRIDRLDKDTQRELTSLSNTIDKRDKETANTLQLILKWKRQSQETLNRAKEYFNGLVRR
jgi:hypothetical protein